MIVSGLTALGSASDSAADGRIDIDEARLEDCDIACYLDAHFDEFGTLTIEASRLHFSGEIILAADDRWPIEIDIALEPGRRAGRSLRLGSENEPLPEDPAGASH